MSRTETRRTTCTRKLRQSIALARECSRDSWQEPRRHRDLYRQISREAMEDARYWRDEIRKLDNQEPDR